ncbi:MAG: discoidin domain-containing protein, partial [Verrucomicrobia bacterium]|nr:discoidin domain-containing protein [Verrucomicrobiota bacterium]
FPTAIAKTRQVLQRLKSTTNFGWDWGVDIWTLGIWKDVRLEATGPARINWTQVQAQLDQDQRRATVNVRLQINSLSDLSARAVLRISDHGEVVSESIRLQLKEGDNSVTGQLVLEHPTLWWPNGQGDQPLYKLTVQLIDADGAPIEVRTTRFGVREIRWEQVEGASSAFVNRFHLLVNGRPVRMMGSCMVPPDLLYGRIMQRGPKLLRRAKAAGMNTLRVWGGGVTLPDEMHDLADEMGIMLSQEFPISIDGLPTDKEFLGNLEQTSRDIVRQLRNHPSIIEWSGGNEMAWRQGSTDPAYQVLCRVAAEEDDRVFRPTCPITGSTHGPWVFDATEGYYRHYNDLVTMRQGEFGAQSPAHLEVWRREIPPSSQWPIHGTDDSILQRKNVVMAVFFPQLWLNQPVIERVFGSPVDLPALVRAGQALAPVSLCLQYGSLFYDPAAGMQVELMLVSDAPQPVEAVKWRWLARDRRGKVFDHGEGAASIAPQQVQRLGKLTLKPPAETARGPILVEMQLNDAAGKLLTERLYVFAARGFKAPWAGLLDQHLAPADDNLPTLVANPPAPDRPIDPKSLENLAYVGNGAKPTTASSARPEPYHQPPGLNDGLYGNSHSWIGTTPRSWFEIDLSKTARIGQFRLGRDRTSGFADRGVDFLKLEASTDHEHWQTVFERSGLTALAAYSPNQTMIVDVAPVAARWVKVTVDPRDPKGAEFACLDEFEIYAPQLQKLELLPQVTVMNAEGPALDRPVRRTTLRVEALAPRIQGDQEVLELLVTNRGDMTALFCEPHPLIAYRTDLFMDNCNCFIPPGESRTITIRAERPEQGGLTLAQTGWRLTTWNADDVVIEPDADVLLAVGRHDRMCGEFKGYSKPDAISLTASTQITVQGQRADASATPFLLGEGSAVTWIFQVDEAHAAGPARLQLHTADQSADASAVVEVTLNGAVYPRALAKGLGVQRRDPAHLAFTQTLTLEVPAGVLRAGQNTLRIRSRNGWWTWDAVDLRSLVH